MSSPVKEIVEYRAFLLIRWIAGWLSFRGTVLLGSWLGSFVYHVFGFRKRVTSENLRHAFPELGEADRDSIALKAYRNYGIAVLQMLWAGNQSDENLLKTVHLPDRRLIDGAFASGRGIILLSGHFGGWELIVHGLRLQLGRPMDIIVQRQRNSRIDRVIDRGRRRHENKTIPMGPSSREALRCLNDGGMLAMLADQSGPKEAVFVTFFGRPAATHRGAAAFSLKTETPIVMVFLVRQPDGVYHAMFEEVDQHDLRGYSDANIDELTRRHVAVLERHIRLHPDHWLWMHKRWKHTPYYESTRRHDEETR